MANKISKYKIGVAKPSEVSVPVEISTKEKLNMPLLAQAWRVYFEGEHVGSSRTLRRGEINRTKKKWFRQKGTGNARHGARSAPIFVGGGKAHGPDGLKRTLSLPKKMTKKALIHAIFLKIKEEKVALVSDISKIKKTKEAAGLLSNLNKKGMVAVVFADKNGETKKYFRNISDVCVLDYTSLNVKDVLRADMIAFDEEIFAKRADSKKTRKDKLDKS